jgi:site-specific DNA recombinase
VSRWVRLGSPIHRRDRRQGDSGPSCPSGIPSRRGRVSTEEQAREGVSLASQRARLKAYATAHDAKLVGIEADEGISGSKAPSKRPGLSSALACLDSGEADGLLVLKLDRLSRSTRDILNLVDATRDNGWRLVSVNEHLDTESAAGRLVLTVLAALSEMEREQIGERVTDAMAHIAREGRGRSRFIPFGYRTAGGGTATRPLP